ncbi:MAG: prepilin-type N-terminal cleavage/methylation domain-containing protein, partial [Planctomycetes bacterium]|nr:prepilin-type N-terminal cleavage/methylation domain-containing protein [Planctomycetota bacterium]
MIDFDYKTVVFLIASDKGEVRARILDRRRYGLTLVELLVVVGVVSVLAAVVLPSVKTVLTDRKASQAAILVRNFMEAARARAIGKNRAVAVVFERLSSRATVGTNGAYVSETATPGPLDPLNPSTNFVPYNACIRLSLAEEPMPITEAMLPGAITITAREPRDGLNPPIPSPGGYVGQDEMLDGDQQDQNGNIIGPMEVRIFRVASTSNI